MNSADHDDCCKPLDSELFNKHTWTCSECGTEWKPQLIGPLRHWRPVPVVLVFQGSAARE